MSTDLPQITQPLIDEVFGILVKMEVELDENPLEYGPRSLNAKTAETRKRLAECEHLFLRVSGWLQKCRAAHRAAETNLELGKKHLLANDPEVRSGRNVADRDAYASMKLRTEVEELSKIKTISEDLEAMLNVIKSKRIDLRDVQSRIRDQMRLCQEELALGGKWGSRVRGKGPDLDAAPDPDHKSLKELREMFAGVDSIKEEAVGDALLSKEVAAVHPEKEIIETDLLPEEDEPSSLAEAPEKAPELPTLPVPEPRSESVASLLGGDSKDAAADEFLETISSEEAAVQKKETDIDDLLRDFNI